MYVTSLKQFLIFGIPGLAAFLAADSADPPY
jgi:hypothetical protein